MVFYREALEMLRECGSQEDVRRVEGKLRNAARRSEDEMHTVETKIELDFAEWDSIVDALITESGDRTIFALALDSSFTPDKEAARSLAQDMQERFPLQSLITNVVVDEQQRVNLIGSGEEYTDAATSRHYGLELQVRLVYLERAFARLRERGLIKADNLSAHFDESPLFAGRRFLWVKAIDYHLAGDHVGSLHVLVPQVEQAVRVLSEQLGQPVTTLIRGEMQLKTLGGLLSNPAVRDGLGRRFAALLSFVLADSQGWNARNEIAHGLATESLFTQAIADLVLLMALRLAAIRLVQQRDLEASE